MKIVVIYGDNETASRGRLASILRGVKKKNWEVQRFDAGKEKRIFEKLSTSPMFSGEILFVIDDFPKLQRDVIAWINEKYDSTEGSLLLYSAKTVPKKTLQTLPKNIKFEEFKLPRKIFTFLDSFIPGNSKACLSLHHDLIPNENPEFVFAMIGRHVRDMYWITEGGEGIDYPSWRKSKLTRQAERFSDNKLKTIINDLAEADVRSKTTRESIVDSLDLIISREL